MVEKKVILKKCMSKGFLVDKSILNSLTLLDESFLDMLINFLSNIKINEKIINLRIFKENFNKMGNLFSHPSNKVSLFLKEIGCEVKIEQDGVESECKKEEHVFKQLSSPVFLPKKIEVNDFVMHFRSRYEKIKNILLEKSLENVKSLRRIGNDRETQTVIVSILEKSVTKNKNLIFSVEDTTGQSKVLVSASKEDIFEKCKEILPDEIVAFQVSGNKEILFANDVFFPDTFLAEKRRGKKDEAIAILSDMHIGSTMFLEKNLLKFLKWINGEEGSEEQKKLAKKIKYLFIVGDSVDGVGVFPNQDEVLNIKDINLQYKKLAELLNLIRKDIKIIMCAGQHDAVWVGEPQPIITEEWAPDLYKMENLSIVPNPSLVEIDEGFKVLMYHGASMHGIIENIPELRLKFKHDSPTRVVKEMLKRRHLAPIHGECDYIPLNSGDPMVIEDIPDIMITGDLHRCEVSSYNNVLTIASSCWQSKTPFEEKVGNNPDPCKVPVFNLKSREIKILDFSDNLEEQEVKVNGE
jgi:DNA polymerase II small subunit